MGDLAVLRTAKLAMNEELITQDDFDQIKVAFLKAQQIKAGMDAGFLREEDYVQARNSFLHSLDFIVHHQHGAPLAAAAAPPGATALPTPPAVPAPVATRTTHPTAAPAGNSSLGLNLNRTGSAGAMPRHLQPPSPTMAGSSAAGAVNELPQPTLSGAFTHRNISSGGQGPPAPPGPGTVPVPADLPKIGRTDAATGKKSMSGIALNEQCISVFNHIKTKSSYKWVSYRIDDTGTQVIIDQLGAPGSTYDQFLACLPENQCRYAVYDYAYSNADTGQTINKLVFFHWAPEGSSIKSKMMYASTKDFLKGFLEGVGAEIQGDCVGELSEAELKDRVGAAMTRK